MLDDLYDDPYDGIIDYEYLMLMQDEAVEEPLLREELVEEISA